MEAADKLVVVSQKINFDDLEDDTHAELKKELEAKSEGLKELVLSGNSYSQDFCEQISEYLKKSGKIENLNINDIFVGRKKHEIPGSLSAFGGALTGKNLLRIDISNNAVGPNGSTALAPYLSQASSLRVFLINNCGLGIDGCTTLSNALKTGAKNLEVWAMARNRIENPGAEQVGKAIAEMPKLKELHIFQNFIRKEGMVHVMKGLTNCPELEVLDVQDNYMKEESAENLAKIIKSCKNITAINVSDCNMEEDDNELVIEALESSELKIQKLGYNYNELTSDQAKRLIDTLLKNESSSLKRLDIKGNEFKKSTKKYYKEALETKGLSSCLSAFESDDEEDEDDLAKNFSELKI